MTRGAKRHVLDEIKRREVLAIVSVGCSRRMAARYVGCSPATIQRTAQRDSVFADQLRKAECKAQIGYMKSIQAAARKEQYWRAAAWALERRNPEEFAARRPDVLTLEQLKGFVVELAEILVEEVPVAAYRKALLKRLERLAAGLGASTPAAQAEDHES